MGHAGLAQNIAIGCLLFPQGTLGLPNWLMGVTLLAVATALTLWSGYVYFADYFAGADPGPPASAEEESE